MPIRVFFDVTIDGASAGPRIVMELAENTPLTSENFRALCAGDHGERLCYRGTDFNCILPKYMVHGGLIGDGVGVYGTTFGDEDFINKHTGPGDLSMANLGANSNGSQFSICLLKAEWLDGKDVVFGHVVEGMETVWKLETYSSPTGAPGAKCVIADCGQL